MIRFTKSLRRFPTEKRVLTTTFSASFNVHRIVPAFSSANFSDQRQNRKEGRFRMLAGVGGAGAFLFGKAKWVVAGTKLLKFKSVFSMLASTGAYAFFFGWPFAVGLVGQIAIHESGHALAMRALNIPFGPAVFIPFMGAVIPMRGRPTDIRQEALVAIAGPVVGGATAFGLSVWGAATGSQLLIALADTGFMLNLFNMMPIGEMDGGRVSNAISKHFLLVGLGGGAYMMYQGFIQNPIFVLVLLSAGFTTFQRYYGGHGAPHPSYYRISGGERMVWAGAYFGLIAALLIGMQINRKKLKSVKQIRHEAPYQPAGEYEHIMSQWADDFGADDPFLSSPVSNSEKEFFAEYFGEKRD